MIYSTATALHLAGRDYEIISDSTDFQPMSKKDAAQVLYVYAMWNKYEGGLKRCGEAIAAYREWKRLGGSE